MSDSANEKLQNIATSIQANENCSSTEAIAKAYERNPTLYSQARAEPVLRKTKAAEVQKSAAQLAGETVLRAKTDQLIEKGMNPTAAYLEACRLMPTAYFAASRGRAPQ